MKISRPLSFLIIFLIYAAATAVGLSVFFLRPVSSDLWNLFLADAAATVFVWLWGLVFRNVSVYDPYWSVAPPVLLTTCAIAWGSATLPSRLLLAAVWIWAVRLTANWACTFRGMEHEDWRYTKYRNEKSPAVFQIINFFGLNMMPTVVVFLCMLPGILLLRDGSSAAGPLTWAGFTLCIAAVALQLASDTQSHNFRKLHRGEVCMVGLWHYGRHPNYLGEILFWWGIWLMYVSIAGIKEAPYMIAGPVLMTCMFRFISVPLMEHRQLATKPGYASYLETTGMFLRFKLKKK